MKMRKTNDGNRKQSSAIKKLQETLFCAIKMCTGFTTDGICITTVSTVSLANHLSSSRRILSFKDSSVLLNN